MPDAPGPPPREGWLRTLLRRFVPQRGDNIAASVQNSEHVTVGKNIVQIGTLVVPLPLLAVVLATLVAGIGVVVWQFNQLAPAGPTRMDGTFNIAIADFVELEARGTPVSRSTSGRQMSEWVYNALQQQRSDYISQYDKANGANLLIWYNGLPRAEKAVPIGAVDSPDPSERQRQAAAVAEKIGADAVVYGVFDTARGLIPEFYVVPSKRYAILDIVGGYQLGSDPVVVAQNDNQAVFRQLAPRTNGLFWLLLGLRYLAFGDAPQAFALLSNAQVATADWHGDAQGEELLYTFKGQSALFAARLLDRQQQPALFQQRLADAKAAFDQAIALNPGYARAYIGRGSVFLTTAETTDAPADLPRSANLDQAMTNYARAKQLAGSDSERIARLADLGLAQAHRLRGQAYYLLNQDAPAEAELRVAATGAQALIDRISAAVDGDERVLGQAYLTLSNAAQQLGVVRRSQNDPAGGAQWHTRARDTAALCAAMRKSPAAQNDAVLLHDVVDRCVQVQAAATASLATLAEGKP